MGNKFIEIRPGCGKDFGLQTEIIPVDQITGMYIVMPEGREIRITFKKGDASFTRTEYYHNKLQCKYRWHHFEALLGLSPTKENSFNQLETNIEESILALSELRNLYAQYINLYNSINNTSENTLSYDASIDEITKHVQDLLDKDTLEEEK